ncbi:hypothetical protein D3C73_984830 [compost metagenome]
MREGFTAAVAGRGGLHQTGVQRVLHVAAQDAVFDQHVALGGVAFVVDVERATAVRQGAVVHDGHALGGDTFTDAARKHAGTLAVEVALKPVANRLVQQDARPARPQHHRHLAGGRGARFQVHHGFVHGTFHVALQHFVGEVSQPQASTAPGVAHFAAAVAFGDHGQ